MSHVIWAASGEMVDAVNSRPWMEVHPGRLAVKRVYRRLSAHADAVTAH